MNATGITLTFIIWKSHEHHTLTTDAKHGHSYVRTRFLLHAQARDIRSGSIS
jgi:hypothetical protein